MIEIKLLKKDLDKVRKEQQKQSYGVFELPNTPEWKDTLEPYLKASERGGELGYVLLYTSKEQYKVRVLRVWETQSVFKMKVRFQY